MASASERWREVDRIVDIALDLAPDGRAPYVEAACAGDAALRADVQRLLRSCDAAADFLERPAAEYAAPLLAAMTPAPPAVAGMRVGPYRVVAEAGRGGMGAVYLAERDDDQYRRRVALKLVRASFDPDGTIVRRFVEERQILASLEHPNIARLLDGGMTTDGLPYFAMEYVQGTPLDRYCDEHRLPGEARLRLFVRVCEAVQYAHRRLVVHRDLKPSNILVTHDGEVKLLDFGIAKLLAPDAAGTPAPATRNGLCLMTPESASPEQLRGEVVSTASDVYSLGVLLYELLAGRRPHAAAGRPAHEVARARAEDEVTRPSVALERGPPATATARARGTTPLRLRRRLRRWRSGRPDFPNVAGTYAITGSFDDLPGATISGPLTLVQADRKSGALGGTITLTLVTGSGTSGTTSGLVDAAVTPAGEVSFSVGAPSGGSASWTFTGTIATGVATAVGRHTLRGVCGTCPGPWAATRQ